VAVVVARAREADLADAQRLMRQVLDRDLGGYRPEWHGDVDDLASAYLRVDGTALFVARLDGRVAGTAAIRPCRLRTPPNPAWLAERYAAPSVCELRRVWVASWARRHGVARALVHAAAGWAVDDGGYGTVYLHTDTGAPGAEAFWRAMPTVEVHDARPDPFNCVHFVLDVDKLRSGRADAAAGDGR
jgi:predicted GNAT superfamily acetyltransferase